MTAVAKRMPSALRKLALTVHITASVGWLGAVIAYLALVVTGLTSPSDPLVRAAYSSMELIGWLAIVPCSVAALVSGLVLSLGSEWGLLRHYWILAKLVLTVVGAAVLFQHMGEVSRMAAFAAASGPLTAELDALRRELLVHAVGGLLVLLAATTLSVFKPWGKTRLGLMRPAQPGGRQAPAAVVVRLRDVLRARGKLVGLVGMVAVVVTIVVWHLSTGGHRAH